jgi:hypothetical protein
VHRGAIPGGSSPPLKLSPGGRGSRVVLKRTGSATMRNNSLPSTRVLLFTLTGPCTTVGPVSPPHGLQSPMNFYAILDELMQRASL